MTLGSASSHEKKEDNEHWAPLDECALFPVKASHRCQKMHHFPRCRNLQWWFWFGVPCWFSWTNPQEENEESSVNISAFLLFMLRICYVMNLCSAIWPFHGHYYRRTVPTHVRFLLHLKRMKRSIEFPIHRFDKLTRDHYVKMIEWTTFHRWWR